MEDKNPYFTIIVPVYKVEDFLEDCIISIINQSYPNFELLLIDDGSPDRSPQICNNWCTKDSRVKVVHKRNGGLSDARNAGLNVATGEYVWFVDSDDWIDKNALKNIANTFKNFPLADIVSTQLVEVINGNSKLYGKYTAFPRGGQVLSNIEYIKKGYPILPSVRFIVRRNLIMSNQLKFIKGILHEDIPFCHMLIYEAQNIAILQKPTYFYRIRKGSISMTPNIKSCYSLVESHRIIKQFMLKHVKERDMGWFKNLTYDYFHEIFIKIYPFINTSEYTKFMNINYKYIRKEFGDLWHYIPLKRKILLLSFYLSPKFYSTLLHKKNNR
jgi:glycosyltransferase involved in cell wall biosynthesis